MSVQQVFVLEGSTTSSPERVQRSY